MSAALAAVAAQESLIGRKAFDLLDRRRVLQGHWRPGSTCSQCGGTGEPAETGEGVGPGIFVSVMGEALLCFLCVQTALLEALADRGEG